MSGESIKTKAIVVRSANSGDNDKMLTLLSPEIGKITVIAKGVKSLKNKSRTGAGVLCYSEFVLKKIREGFYSLSQAELLESFSPLSESVEALSLANYLASLCEMCVQINESADSEVRLLLNSLYVLTKRPDKLHLIKAVFELKMCEIFGVMPEFNKECPCGKPALYFCVTDGEMRCTEHRGEKNVLLSKELYSILSYISNSSLRDSLYMNCNYGEISKISQITEPFLEYHLGKLPKALNYLHNILK